MFSCAHIEQRQEKVSCDTELKRLMKDLQYRQRIISFCANWIWGSGDDRLGDIVQIIGIEESLFVVLLEPKYPAEVSIKDIYLSIFNLFHSILAVNHSCSQHIQ